MVMPESMTGLELANRLKQDKSSLKIIISSGYSADLAGNSVVPGPEIAFLAKPYPMVELAKTVRQCLDNH
jgi:CheY-like chemotaxis protein